MKFLKSRDGYFAACTWFCNRCYTVKRVDGVDGGWVAVYSSYQTGEVYAKGTGRTREDACEAARKAS